ncbi:MAG: ABC transporter ATP-binding protein [Chloroflexota bacterium]
MRDTADNTATTTGMHLEARDITVRFGETVAVEGASLSVEPGELVALLGPSGCGKSTLLNVLAGLVEPQSGEVLIDGRRSPNRLGDLAYMPQRDALLPWRTVIGNATLAAEVTGRDVNQARERARDLLPRFGLEGFGDHRPAALSGGMRQRAAFLRTVLTDREIMLLDEPFGALDALTRRSMQEWLLDLWNDLGQTILMVTHDVEEALILSDRVAVMTARPGRIKIVEQVRVPRPRSLDAVTDPRFVEQKAQLYSSLREEIHELGLSR